MKKIVAIILILAVGCLVLASCGSDGGSKDAANSIVGVWEYESGGFTYTFNEDGTGEYAGRTFTYTTDGNKISILYDGDTAAFESEFSIDGDKLNIKDSFGSDTIYVKK